MKRYIFYIGAMLMLMTEVMAQEHCGLTVTSASMKRNAGLMTVGMDMKLSDFELPANQVAVFTPAIIGEQDSLLLRPVGLYSRIRWFQYLRSGDGPVSGADETVIRWSERPDELAYSETVPYAEWMNGSRLVLFRKDYSCCRNMIAEECEALSGYREVYFTPVFRYVQPSAEQVKTRELSGRAYIDFPVNRTEIHPDYRGNSRELAKIVGTIDSVRNDADITITSITIKGYASPEGSYANNSRLAKGRTEALKLYVQQLYHFPNDFIQTDYEPEDWAGLREYVETSTLQHRSEILAIIDSQLEPDPKNTKIQTTYPEEYRFLLSTVYPGLRHSDYTIEYMIRSFTDPKEIGELFRAAPQKLNMTEMLLYAHSLEAGSNEFNEVFDTAVRMFPADETANLNAANSAMQRGDLINAGKYLANAGESAEAVYARGMLTALQGDYEGAVALVTRAQSMGLADCGDVIENLNDVIRNRQ